MFQAIGIWDLALPTDRHPTTMNLILDTNYLFHYELCISFKYDQQLNLA